MGGSFPHLSCPRGDGDAQPRSTFSPDSRSQAGQVGLCALTVTLTLTLAQTAGHELRRPDTGSDRRTRAHTAGHGLRQPDTGSERRTQAQTAGHGLRRPDTGSDGRTWGSDGQTRAQTSRHGLRWPGMGSDGQTWAQPLHEHTGRSKAARVWIREVETALVDEAPWTPHWTLLSTNGLRSGDVVHSPPHTETPKTPCPCNSSSSSSRPRARPDRVLFFLTDPVERVLDTSTCPAARR